MKTCEEYIREYHLEYLMPKELSGCLELKYYARGEYLMHSNQLLNELLFIVEGRAKTLYTTHNGETTLHSFLTPFAIVGDVELLGGQRVINDVIAVEDTTCIAISLRYKELCLQNHAFVVALARELSNKLARSNHNKSVSLTYPVEKRLAAYLCASAVDLHFSQNQQDAAEMIGCSYRQLQRTLQMFVKQGLLQKKQKGTYVIIAMQALQALGEDVYVI